MRGLRRPREGERSPVTGLRGDSDMADSTRVPGPAPAAAAPTRAGPVVTATPEQPLALPVTQKREFWVLMAYAVVLGVFGAFAGLIFVGAITLGGKWYDDSDPGWFGGHWWWVAVAAAAGIAVGLARRLTRLPWKTPGLFDDLQTEHVDTKLVPGIAAVSVVSL